MLVLQPLCGKHPHNASISSCRRWAAYLLPPRRFWQQALGGLTLLDLAVLCFLAAVNIIWAAALLTSSWRQLLLESAFQGYAAPANVRAMIVMMLAKCCGSLLAPNLVLLLYPISRGSVVLQAMRLPYPEAIR
ncbi:hypothetical protein OEZ85_005041 [Tetradesmus obliquus]|uniref:Uncharacterized protein n=1 Tax=Tetradesmus obliquus TaxID=3088 RepID=A0ABY8UGQ6_TETOB|nr:hypothetical protein OEZ85_005041 [Tetradesmus obliquus]